MTSHKFIKKLLFLKDLTITWIALKNRNRELHLGVTPYKNGCLCPHCFRRGRILRHRSAARAWIDLPIGRIKVIFWYSPKEIRCPTHGRVQENMPWATGHSRVSYRFEYVLLVYCQIMTQKAAARLLCIAQSTLSVLLHRTITRLRDGHRIRNLKTIGVDEISYCKGHKYATIVYDLDKARVVWVGPGKGRETIDKFFNEQLSDHQKSKIEFASCDMSQAYIGAIEKHCPNATLVLDHYHICKALNEAVDEVRKEQWREAQKDERKCLKGLRWLLFRNSSNRSKKDTGILNALSKGNRRIHRAWVLKDEFEQFWNYKYQRSAEKFLKAWLTTALRSRLKPLRKFVQTIKTHMKRILPFIKTRLTNAKAEGINR